MADDGVFDFYCLADVGVVASDGENGAIGVKTKLFVLGVITGPPQLNE